jgi:glucokinase
MNAPALTVLGIDVGGTKTAAGIVGFPGAHLLGQVSFDTQPKRGGEALLEEVAFAAGQLAAHAQQAGHAISAVGIGICELVGFSGQILSRNCIEWEANRVRQRLSHLAPVTIQADVRAAALAEALFGAGQPFPIFLFITVGTGIASCLMNEGVAYLGARGLTGTMASSSLSLLCESCGKFSRRTLEEVASGPALVSRYNHLKPARMTRGQEVLAAAKAGDALALHVVQSGGEALGASVGLLVNVLDPAAVVVGGGLGLSQGPFWDSFLTATRAHIWSEVHRNLPILQAATGVQAGLIGAAASAWRANVQSRGMA